MRNFLYIGISGNAHDLRFIEALWRVGNVERAFTKEGPIQGVNFSNFNSIVAGPLTGPISILPKELNRPLIGMCHAYEVNETPIGSSEYVNLRMNIARCDLVICDSEHIKNHLRSEYGCTAPIKVIPYGCDLTLFRESEYIRYSKIRLISMRNWTNIHSNNLIIEALKNLDSLEELEKIVFLGDGPELSQNIKNVENLKLNTSIEFLGSVSPKEIADAIASSNVYVSASRSDGISVSLMEAMAGSLVPCTSDFPSNLEVIESGVNGFYFKNGDAASLTDTLKKIISLPIEMRSKIAWNARRTAEERFDWEKNSAILQHTITEVVKN